MQSTIAIICDCDDTLMPDTTNFLLEENGIDSRVFWKKIAGMVKLGWDPPQAYTSEIIRLMQQNKIEQNTRKKLAGLGRRIIPFDGVPKFISQLKSFVLEKSEFVEAQVGMEFYIISSGFEDLIGGTKVAPHVTDIFAGRFSENNETKRINGIKSTVTFTEKTKFVYAINKGIHGKEIRRCPFIINEAVRAENRRVPFEHMIYIGDSPGDIPCFSTIKSNGGHCIGVMGRQTVRKGYELARGNRTTVGPYTRNYTRNSDLYNMLETIISEIGSKIADRRARNL